MKNLLSIILAVVIMLLFVGCSKQSEGRSSKEADRKSLAADEDDSSTAPGKRTEPAANADINALSVSEGALSPAFSTDTEAYTVIVPNSVSSITVECTPAIVDAAVVYNPSQPAGLSVGSNNITVTVTSRDGTATRDYIITVNRAQKNMTDLRFLTVSEGTLTPSFVTTVLAYTVNVADSVRSIRVKGAPADKNATVNFDPSQPAGLRKGSNTVTATVTAEDGTTTRDFVITVNRLPPSTITDLRNLTVSDGTLRPVFETGTMAYTLDVPSRVSSLTVTGIPVHPYASISYSPSQPASLSTGPNTITATVTSEKGTTVAEYVIEVNRAYAIGDKGPAGGVVFYDDETDGDNKDTIPGVRYLEAAPAGWNNTSEDPVLAWGGYEALCSTCTVPAVTSSEIGKGEANTADLLARGHENCHSNPTSGSGTHDAAKAASEYSVTNGGIEYTNWFLPSKDELIMMYNNLQNQMQAIRDFESDYYWSSSEFNNLYSWTVVFSNGSETYNYKYHTFRIRPVRAF